MAHALAVGNSWEDGSINSIYSCSCTAWAASQVCNGRLLWGFLLTC